LASVVNELYGIDYLTEEVEMLRDRGYNVEVANAETFALDRTFDVITAGELIEHLSNPVLFLDRVSEHLAPGGKLVLTTPNPWSFHRFRSALFDDVWSNPEHTCWFDERTLQSILKRHGFDIKTLRHLRPPLKRVVSTDNPNILSVTTLLFDLGLARIGSPTLFVVARPATQAE
jgi:SAM-dependent methyltransferase